VPVLPFARRPSLAAASEARTTDNNKQCAIHGVPVPKQGNRLYVKRTYSGRLYPLRGRRLLSALLSPCVATATRPVRASWPGMAAAQKVRRKFGSWKTCHRPSASDLGYFVLYPAGRICYTELR
jgi:hypothetical protein